MRAKQKPHQFIISREAKTVWWSFCHVEARNCVKEHAQALQASVSRSETSSAEEAEVFSAEKIRGSS